MCGMEASRGKGVENLARVSLEFSALNRIGKEIKMAGGSQITRTG